MLKSTSLGFDETLGIEALEESMTSDEAEAKNSWLLILPEFLVKQEEDRRLSFSNCLY